MCQLSCWLQLFKRRWQSQYTLPLWYIFLVRSRLLFCLSCWILMRRSYCSASVVQCKIFKDTMNLSSSRVFSERLRCECQSNFMHAMRKWTSVPNHQSFDNNVMFSWLVLFGAAICLHALPSRIVLPVHLQWSFGMWVGLLECFECHHLFQLCSRVLLHCNRANAMPGWILVRCIEYSVSAL